MNKLGYIFSWILTLIGIIFMFIDFLAYVCMRSFIPTINEKLFPGKTYILDFTIPTSISIVCIILGIVMSYYFYKKDTYKK
jgi:hypothetical protein